MTFLRYVALGDSFAEGVGDPDPTRPNGLRGWADRVAEVLAGRGPGFAYANLAIRGRKLTAILDEQVEPAIALRPDLITLYAGGNDLMRPSVDIDAIVARYDQAIGRLASTGATIVLWTGFDAGGSKVFGRMRGRTAIYNELVREVADRHGSVLVDFWRFPEFRDWRMWDADRLHLATPGHQQMAIRVLDTLGVPHALTPPTLPPHQRLSRTEQWREDLDWVRAHAAPWVKRRLTGASSGDGVTAKRPALEPIGPAGGDTRAAG